jgi:hypothetical protein
MKIIKYLIVSLCLVILGATGYWFFSSPLKAKANPSSVHVLWMAKNGGAGSATETAVATTTTGVTWMAANGATTTMPFLVNGSEQVDLIVRQGASSTATSLLFTIDFSNDALCDSAPDKCNWFPDSNITTNSNVSSTVGSTTMVYDWHPGTAANATSTFSASFYKINAGYMRFNFQATGAAGNLWAQVAKKVQMP